LTKQEASGTRANGRVVIEGGEYKGKPGDGRFLKRGTCVNV
jgi:hypothetical protein